MQMEDITCKGKKMEKIKTLIKKEQKNKNIIQKFGKSTKNRLTDKLKSDTIDKHM